MYEKVATLFSRMIRSLALRHLFPFTVTVVLVVGGAAIITLPLAGVFLLDDEFVVGDYLKFLLSALGVGVALSTIIFPLAWVLERFVDKKKPLVLVPLLIVLAAGTCVLVRVLATHEVLDTVFGWAGLFLALSLIFCFYWMALLASRGFGYAIQKYRRRAMAT